MKMQYEVTVECVVTKIVTCEDCTEEEARSDPFNYSVDEIEISQLDWETISVKAMPEPTRG